MTHAQYPVLDEPTERPSTFAAALAGLPPSIRLPPPPRSVRLPPGAVRRHFLDDVPVASNDNPSIP